ncbi:MAG: hypothetical protein AAF658_08620 [Myxococcota bacterium]
MSEPYSLIVSMPWNAEQFREAFNTTQPLARTYEDWSKTELECSDEILILTDRTASLTARALFEAEREDSLEQGDWHFELGPGADGPPAMVRGPRFTFIKLLWRENQAEILSSLAVLRGFAASASRWEPATPAFILVHDYVFGHHGTVGALFAGGGTSKLYGPDAPEVGALVSQMQPLADAHRDRIDAAYDADEDPAAAVIDHFSQVV